MANYRHFSQKKNDKKQQLFYNVDEFVTETIKHLKPYSALSLSWISSPLPSLHPSLPLFLSLSPV